MRQVFRLRELTDGCSGVHYREWAAQVIRTIAAQSNHRLLIDRVLTKYYRSAYLEISSVMLDGAGLLAEVRSIMTQP